MQANTGHQPTRLSPSRKKQDKEEPDKNNGAEKTGYSDVDEGRLGPGSELNAVPPDGKRDDLPPDGSKLQEPH